jgi:uncharacterized protein (DUF427 family)
MEPTAEILRNREKWAHTGRLRPPWAEEPGPGQQSVWDFPRPPRIEPVAEIVRVVFGGRVIAESAEALRVLETASPPTVYVPPGDTEHDALVGSATITLCEWKGRARHFGLAFGPSVAVDAAWAYEDPFPEFERLRGYLSFHPGRVDRCSIGGSTALPQPGEYYGGWVTPDLVGPFKGAPGSAGW